MCLPFLFTRYQGINQESNACVTSLSYLPSPVFHFMFSYVCVFYIYIYIYLHCATSWALFSSLLSVFKDLEAGWWPTQLSTNSSTVCPDSSSGWEWLPGALYVVTLPQ